MTQDEADYLRGRALAADETLSFEALIQAAMRRASTLQHDLLSRAFPEVAKNLAERARPQNGTINVRLQTK